LSTDVGNAEAATLQPTRNLDATDPQPGRNLRWSTPGST